MAEKDRNEGRATIEPDHHKLIQDAIVSLGPTWIVEAMKAQAAREVRTQEKLEKPLWRAATQPVRQDNWSDTGTFECATCQWYATKERVGGEGIAVGRCRRHAPTMGGYPVVWPTDWCGDHKLGTPPR